MVESCSSQYEMCNNNDAMENMIKKNGENKRKKFRFGKDIRSQEASNSARKNSRDISKKLSLTQKKPFLNYLLKTALLLGVLLHTNIVCNTVSACKILLKGSLETN